MTFSDAIKTCLNKYANFNVLLLDKLQELAAWGVGLPEPTAPDGPSVTLSDTPDAGAGGSGSSGPVVH
ncbi:hypothetical protein ICV01_04255 [Polynucleobacter sp. MWH-Spelu-300-X4]|uniref:hypothetical protein n=1 Tax=Polynucleobacter sp. MWH-Spelu-300-X4 TaxID=2689109 RepID=UPI001BFED277|nr:hypothetical protein [Polynucleobacter sp. MWH-Spelu-300-X4]QWD80525.1 hypothetical protein ICV01_04255 [Polynucleobacter sp. MWH-Spelu-300-X4]